MGTYPFTCLMLVGHSHDEAVRSVSKWAKHPINIPDYVSFDADGFTLWLPEGFYVIWLHDFQFSIPYIGMLVHELSHLADDLFTRLRIGSDPEAFSYQLQYLVEQALAKLKKS